MDRAFLIGKDVFLRPFELDDVRGDYIKWVNDPLIGKFLDSPFPRTVHDLEEYVKTVNSDSHYVFFAVIEKKTGKHIGNAKLGPIDWVHRRTNFGRMLSRECWGKGYGAQVVSLLVQYTFDRLNLNRIIEHNVADNIGAIKSNEKGGLDIEGKIEEFVFADGAYRDVVVVGLTRKRYEKKKNDGFFPSQKTEERL